MSYQLVPCPHDEDGRRCAVVHGVIYVPGPTSRPAPTDSVVLGDGGDTSTLPETPDALGPVSARRAPARTGTSRRRLPPSGVVGGPFIRGAVT